MQDIAVSVHLDHLDSLRSRLNSDFAGFHFVLILGLYLVCTLFLKMLLYCRSVIGLALVKVQCVRYDVTRPRLCFLKHMAVNRGRSIYDISL